MNRFKGWLIATDFDGTLNDDSGQTPQSVLQAIRYFTQEGGYFTACTGRTYQGLGWYPHMALFNAPVLLANGAMAYDFRTREITFLHGIGDEGVPVLRAFCAAFPDVSVELYPFGQTFSIHLTPDSERHFTSQGIVFQQIDDPADAPRPWAKVMLGCPDAARSAEVQEWLRHVTATSFLETTGKFVEILRNGVDKGTGLLCLADRLSVKHDYVVAVGDGYNDVQMLKAAALSFAPCNGSSEATAAATQIVRSNNDGTIAHVIEILDDVVQRG